MDEESVVVENEAAPEVVERARIQGWVPLEDFKGDKERWISAEEFVQRADTVMPILKTQNKKLESKVLNLEKDLREQKELSKKMIKIHSKYSEDFYNDRINTIKRQKAVAVENSDLELYNRLEIEEKNLPLPEKIEIEEQPQIDPEVARWQEENSHWFGVDAELTEYTNIIADRIAKKGHNLPPYEFCEEVKKKVKQMFPNKFNGNSNRATGVDEGSSRGSDASTAKKGKSWNDLPKDAREQCSSLMATIPGYTKERYLKDYFEGA